MSRAGRLIEEHQGVFDGREFAWADREFRIRVALRDTGESWLAETGGGRVGLRRCGSDDGEIELAVEIDSGDFERHMTGADDLISTLRPEEFAFGGRAASPSGREGLLPTLRHLLHTLALPSQCDPRFRDTEIWRLYLTNCSLRADGTPESMGTWSLPYYAGQILYDLVAARKPERTLEVGMAHAASSLFIAQGLRDNGVGRHVAIDPWQTRGFGALGIENLRRAGLDDLVTVVEEPNYAALPRLLEDGAGSYQLVFIDGLHIFDHVLLDFFYADLLLAPGGLVVFDDSDLPAVESALSFIAENRHDSYELLPSWTRGRLTVLEKQAEDKRVDEYGVVFHRHFESAGRVTPLAAPRWPRFLKHALDRVAALVAVVLLAPLGLAIAPAIAAGDLLTGRRPSSPFQREPLYSAGRRFDALTFRTEGPEGPTPVGRLLRKLKLYALPKLLNVVQGRMSVVGPTPVSPDDRVRRAKYEACGMRAGLAGIQSIQGGQGDEYYEEYVKRGHLALLAFDLKLLWRVLRGGR